MEALDRLQQEEELSLVTALDRLQQETELSVVTARHWTDYNGKQLYVAKPRHTNTN